MVTLNTAPAEKAEKHSCHYREGSKFCKRYSCLCCIIVEVFVVLHFYSPFVTEVGKYHVLTAHQSYRVSIDHIDDSSFTMCIIKKNLQNWGEKDKLDIF